MALKCQMHNLSPLWKPFPRVGAFIRVKYDYILMSFWLHLIAYKQAIWAMYVWFIYFITWKDPFPYLQVTKKRKCGNCFNAFREFLLLPISSTIKQRFLTAIQESCADNQASRRHIQVFIFTYKSKHYPWSVDLPIAPFPAIKHVYKMLSFGCERCWRRPEAHYEAFFCFFI